MKLAFPTLTKLMMKSLGANFAIFYKTDAGVDSVLLFDGHTRQGTRFSAQTVQYPVELGWNQVEFKFAEPTVINMTGIITRKGTGALGVTIGLSSIVAGSKTKNTLIKEARKDIKYLKDNLILCEIWSLNGGNEQYMTLVEADIADDTEHVGLFEANLSFREVRELILEPEPLKSLLAGKISTGVAQCVQI